MNITRKIIIVLLMLILPVFALGETLEIHFIDVGEADAAILISDGAVLMIDGGSASKSDLIYSYIKNKLKIGRIDFMIATHPHEDHIGGLSGALNACCVGTIYSPVAEYDSRAFDSLLKYAALQNTALTVPIPGDSFTFGSARAQFLSPGGEYDNINDCSLVVRIVCGKNAFLFMGDAEWDAEHDLLNSGYLLSADLIKIGHHGSDTSTCYRLLDEVMPDYAVVSVGENAYGHPSETVLRRLRDAGTTVYRTDLSGNIICRSDGNKLIFECEK